MKKEVIESAAKKMLLAGYSEQEVTEHIYGKLSGMQKKADYQGWSNYETWAVALWFYNDEGLRDMWSERAGELDKQDDVYTLADEMKNFVEENNPLGDEASFYADLMNAAISEVNFDEIANGYLEEYGLQGEPAEPEE